MLMVRCFLLGSLFSIASIAAHARPLADAPFPSVRLMVKGNPDVAQNVIWAKGGKDGIIDIGMNPDIEVPETGTALPLLVEVKARSHGTFSSVRQRSVTYLNVGDEGPHRAVQGSERRGAWTGLKPLSGGRFVLQPARKQHITMQHKKFARAFRGAPRWATLLAKCTSPDSGACYTVTDLELEVTSIDQKRRTTRKIIRIAFPNGC